MSKHLDAILNVVRENFAPNQIIRYTDEFGDQKSVKPFDVMSHADEYRTLFDINEQTAELHAREIVRCIKERGILRKPPDRMVGFFYSPYYGQEWKEFYKTRSEIKAAYPAIYFDVPVSSGAAIASSIDHWRKRVETVSQSDIARLKKNFLAESTRHLNRVVRLVNDVSRPIIDSELMLPLRPPCSQDELSEFSEWMDAMRCLEEHPDIYAALRERWDLDDALEPAGPRDGSVRRTGGPI